MTLWTPSDAAPDALVTSVTTLSGEALWGWHGRIRVTIRHTDGSISIDEFDNLITDVGHGLMRDVLRGTVTDGKIKYMALGTSSTAAAAGQTALGAETFRKAVTSYSPSGANAVISNTYLAPGDAVGTAIAELGWFAGSTASGTANSGVMVARVLYSHTKTNVESIQVQRTDTFS